MAENDKIIVSRIQHRRGLKQDLPQPLRPGEIGLATDSRQVYIGGDPNDVNSASYNAVSYFENTLGAKDHVVSIANNQIIAFSVPFVKYSRGEYNGITTVKSWQPTDARSIISGSVSPKDRYHGAEYDIFNAKITANIVSTVDTSTVGSPTVYVTSTASSDSDATANIRIGDRVTGNTVPSNVSVSNVSKDNIGIKVTLTAAQSLTAGETLTFIPQTALNYNNYKEVADTTFAGHQTKFSEASFKSTDVSVHKNGIKLIPEANAEIVDMPSATADYVLDGSNVSATGIHSLTLRTRPAVTDEVTVCYYGNANVVQAITGISTGKIATHSSVDSFYTQYNIPEYRHIPAENIRVSETTGLGYIGLQQKHIQASHDGANISSPSSVSLGDFLIARLDDTQETDDVSYNSSVTGSDLYDINFTSAGDENGYSPISDTGIYRYNRVYLTSTNTTDYLHNKVFDVITATNDTGYITVSVPTIDWEMTRSATANIAPTSAYTGNGFTSNVSATKTVIRMFADAEGIAVNDYVRVIADTSIDPDTANSELHDTVFKVSNRTTTYFDVDISTANIAGNTVPNFTANVSSIKFVNHGSNVSLIDSVYQVKADAHGLTTGTGTIRVTEEDHPIISSDWNVNDVITIDTNSLTDNTLYFTGISYSPASGSNATSEYTPGISGNFKPVLSSSFTTITVVPTLAIDLSANTTVKDAIATINKPKVSTEAGGAETIIFPYVDYLPKSDGTRNQLYVSTKPTYSSVSVGGLEFALFNDSQNTMSALGLTPGVYDRENNSVKAKLETWMNDLVNNREVNLFSNIFTGGSLYANLSPNHFNNYNLTIDETFGEVLFGSRQESADFNYIVNSAYSESVYDRAEDTQNGSRGLINLKNNLEIQTREAASVGEKIVTYTSLEGTSILQSDGVGDTIFTIDASRYNSFVLDYTMVESPVGGTNKYMRQGTMSVSVRTDFTDSSNAVILSDNFSSHWELSHSDPVVEPKFSVVVNGDDVVFSMEGQHRDPDNPDPSDLIAHSLDTSIKFKYVYRRWSSTD